MTELSIIKKNRTKRKPLVNVKRCPGSLGFASYAHASGTTRRNSDVDAEVSVVSEKVCYSGIKN